MGRLRVSDEALEVKNETLRHHLLDKFPAHKEKFQLTTSELSKSSVKGRDE